MSLGSGGCGSGSSGAGASGPGSSASSGAEAAAPGPVGREDGDGSITGFGAAAGGRTEAVVAAAVHSFFGDLASKDYRGTCAALAAPNREQLAAFGGGRGGSASCAGALRKLLSPALVGEARASAEARIDSVRIKGDTAFSLFRAAGGTVSYVVMKREAGGWKSVSLTPGTPLEPTAGS